MCDWKLLTRELNSYFRKIPIQRSDTQTGVSGHIHGSSADFLFQVIKDSLTDRKRDLKNETFMDAGCGEGYVLYPYGLQGFQNVLGMDHNPIALSGLGHFAAQRAPLENAYCAYGDLFDLTSLGSVSILYMFNAVFPPNLNLHLFQLIQKSSHVHTIIVTQRSIRQVKKYMKERALSKENKAIQDWLEKMKPMKKFVLKYGHNSQIEMVLLVNSEKTASTRSRLQFPRSYNRTITFYPLHTIHEKINDLGKRSRKRKQIV